MEKEKEKEEEVEQISLNDLASLRNIVNVASRRGAFAAEEFTDVGKVYTKLDLFLKQQAKLLELDEKKEGDNVNSSSEQID